VATYVCGTIFARVRINFHTVFLNFHTVFSNFHTVFSNFRTVFLNFRTCVFKLKIMIVFHSASKKDSPDFWVHSFIEALWVNGLFQTCFVSHFLPIPLKSPFRTFRILQSAFRRTPCVSTFTLSGARRAPLHSCLRAFAPSRHSGGRKNCFSQRLKKKILSTFGVFEIFIYFCIRKFLSEQGKVLSLRFVVSLR
jgi:hypothetical protein